MLEAGAVREVLVSRHDEKWGLAIRLGGAGSRWLPVRSRREALRTWGQSDRWERFCRSPGYQGLCRRAVAIRQAHTVVVRRPTDRLTSIQSG